VKNYDYHVTAVEIIPPMLHGASWAGKIKYMYETSTGKDIPIDTSLFLETWGKTKQEAEEKMKQDVNNWILSNS